jgi:transcriptional regulator
VPTIAKDLVMKYQATNKEHILDLVLQNPLAWLVTENHSSALPLLAHTNTLNQITQISGHFSRTNPLHIELKKNPAATILFLGPNSYMSPSSLKDRTQAPTWMYASVSFKVKVRVNDDEQMLQAHLFELSKFMEEGRANPWSPQEMGERLSKLSNAIITFTADVLETKATFKLGQDERDDVFEDIYTEMSKDPSQDILPWMRRYNPSRTPNP